MAYCEHIHTYLSICFFPLVDRNNKSCFLAWHSAQIWNYSLFHSNKPWFVSQEQALTCWSWFVCSTTNHGWSLNGTCPCLQFLEILLLPEQILLPSPLFNFHIFFSKKKTILSSLPKSLTFHSCSNALATKHKDHCCLHLQARRNTLHFPDQPLAMAYYGMQMQPLR